MKSLLLLIALSFSVPSFALENGDKVVLSLFPDFGDNIKLENLIFFDGSGVVNYDINVESGYGVNVEYFRKTTKEETKHSYYVGFGLNVTNERKFESGTVSGTINAAIDPTSLFATNFKMQPVSFYAAFNGIFENGFHFTFGLGVASTGFEATFVDTSGNHQKYESEVGAMARLGIGYFKDKFMIALIGQGYVHDVVYTLDGMEAAIGEVTYSQTMIQLGVVF